MIPRFALLAVVCGVLLQVAGCKTNYLKTAQLVSNTPVTTSSHPVDIPLGQITACGLDMNEFALELGSPDDGKRITFGDQEGAAQRPVVQASVVDDSSVEHALEGGGVMFTPDANYVVFRVENMALIRPGSTLRVRSSRELVFRRVLLMCYRHTDRAQVELRSERTIGNTIRVRAEYVGCSLAQTVVVPIEHCGVPLYFAFNPEPRLATLNALGSDALL